MFWFGSKERAELAEARNRVAQLQSDLSMQQRLAENRLQELNELRNDRLEKSRACSVGVDFDQMDAFSIERMYDANGTSRTVIGYLKGLPEDTPDIGEWTLHCNEEIHEKLVEQFIATRLNQESESE